MVGELSEDIDDLEVGIEDGVVYVGEEVSVFEVEEDKEVKYYACDHPCFAS